MNRDNSALTSSAVPENESGHVGNVMKEVICTSCQRSVRGDAMTGGLCPCCLIHLALVNDSDDKQPARPVVTWKDGMDEPQVLWLEESLPQFEKFALVGRGGVGEVFRARQRSLDRDVAIKVLSVQKSAAPDFVERFHQEAVSLAMLSHPLIVSVYEFGQVRGRPYLVMEFADGVTLRELLCNGPLDPGQAVLIAWLICSALQYAHSMGIAHRDIKPENILVDEESLAHHNSSHASLATSLQGAVKVTDFGLARLLEGTSDAKRLTAVGHVVGTPYYMAPEQRYAAESVDERADIYAVGVLLYEMLTGILPQGRVRPPSEFASIDKQVDAIVFRCVEAEPDRRYQSVSELIHDLESIPAFELTPYNTLSWRRAAVLAGVISAVVCFCIYIFAFVWMNATEAESTAGSFVSGISGELNRANTERAQLLHATVKSPAKATAPDRPHRSLALTVPVAVDDLVVVEQFGRQLIRFDFLTANDTLPAEQRVEVVSVTQPQFGRLERKADGFLYRPKAFFTGFDRFIYRLEIDGVRSLDNAVNLFVTSQARYDAVAGKPLQCSLRSLFAARTPGSFLVAPGNTAPPIHPERADYVDPNSGAPGPIWKYFDQTEPPDAGWETFDFDDSEWKSGSGELGYAKNSDDPPVRTVIRKTPASFFRHAFHVKEGEKINRLTGHLLRDDGAAVYLNGVEVERHRLMAGAPPEAWALSKTYELNHEESVYFPFEVDPQLLRKGRNVIAVEVHQHSTTSSDCGFDFALTTSSLGLLANAGHQERVRLVKEPQHGALDLRPDGTFNYVPDSEFSGMDRFTYLIHRSESVSNPVSVDLAVHEVAEVRIDWLPQKKPTRGKKSKGQVGTLRFSRSGDTSLALRTRYTAKSHVNGPAVADYETDQPDQFYSGKASAKTSALTGSVEIPAGRRFVDLPVMRHEPEPRSGVKGSLTIELLPTPFYYVASSSAVVQIGETP